MISVIIPTLNAARLLPPAFQSLFEAAMDGLVSEVIVSDSGSTDATLAIAEAAGATVIAARGGQQRLAGVLAAKKPWLLFLEPGDVIERGWQQEIRSFIAKGESRAAAFRMRKGKGIRLAPNEAFAALRFRLSGRPPKGQALLVPAKLLQKADGPVSRPQDDDAALMRELCRSAFVRLKAAVSQEAG
jgi:glycosyltransferase involved in cell wall biosynthesis